MLNLYYTSLKNDDERRKFVQEVIDKCKVTYPIVMAWKKPQNKPGYRKPKPIYRPILADITGIKEEKLFKS